MLVQEKLSCLQLKTFNGANLVMWWVSRQARMHACIFPMHHPRQDDDDLSWRTVEDACVSSSPPHHSISCISCISCPFWNISKRCWCWAPKSCCTIGLSSSFSSSTARFLSKVWALSCIKSIGRLAIQNTKTCISQFNFLTTSHNSRHNRPSS